MSAIGNPVFYILMGIIGMVCFVLAIVLFVKSSGKRLAAQGLSPEAQASTKKRRIISGLILLLVSLFLIGAFAAISIMDVTIRAASQGQLDLRKGTYLVNVYSKMTDANKSLEEYNVCVVEYDSTGPTPELNKRFNDICKDLKEHGTDMKNISSPDKNWDLYRNVQTAGNSLIQLGNESPNAYENDDFNLKLKLTDTLQNVAESFMSISESLDLMQTSGVNVE